MSKNGSNLPRRLLATGLAACAHLVVLLLLGWRVPRLVIAPAGPEVGVMEITLMRPPPRPRPRPAAKPARSAPSTPALAPRVLIAPTAGAPAVIEPVPSPPAPAPPVVDASPNDDHLRNALRGLTGCGDPSAYGLSHEERAKCDQRLAAAKPAPVGSQLSAEELRQFDPPKQPPIFIRKPHNGCLPHAGDTPSPLGSNAKTTTLGIACGWSF